MDVSTEHSEASVSGIRGWESPAPRGPSSGQLQKAAEAVPAWKSPQAEEPPQKPWSGTVPHPTLLRGASVAFRKGLRATHRPQGRVEDLKLILEQQ